MKIELGQKAYHTDIYNGKEEFTIIGIREHEVELQGDFSGGTHNVVQSGWFSRKGLIFKDGLEQSDMERIPKWLSSEKIIVNRLKEVKEILVQTTVNRKPMPTEWIDEYNELVSELEKKKEESDNKSITSDIISQFLIKIEDKERLNEVLIEENWFMGSIGENINKQCQVYRKNSMVYFKNYDGNTYELNLGIFSQFLVRNKPLKHSQLVKDLQHYKDSSFALLKTDKEPKQIADAITKMLSEHLELKSVDSFDVRESITNYLSSVLFRF